MPLFMFDSEGNIIDKPSGKSKQVNCVISDLNKCEEKVIRFVEKEDLIGYRIIADSVTGVNYLETSRGGITPLLDKSGKVVIDKNKED